MGGAQCHQHVICRQPERVHQTAWQRGRWHPCLLPQRQQRHCQAWLILQCQLGPIPPTHTKTWGGFPKVQWHPHLLPQRRQCHRQARPVLSFHLGLLPSTLYQQWGGAPPWQHAVLWNAVNSIWHSPCLNAQDLLMQIHGQWQTSMLLPLSSNVGIDDTPSVDTWHGKPDDALPSLQSSAKNGASGLITGLPSRPYSARNASACSCCVAAHWHTPCWFGVIADHLPPQPTKPPTLRSSIIPSGIVVCRYHEGGGLDKTIILVVARVKGIGPVLPILEGGCCACLFVFGLHSLLWQHWNYALGPEGHCFHPTSHPTQLL